MKTGIFGLCVLLGVSAAAAQEAPKPGPEHERLKKLEGTWDAAGKSPLDGKDFKGEMVFKSVLGGLWLESSFNCTFGEMKFSGRGLDGYDPAKKKYVSIWVDSWSTVPMVSEGTYDEAAKTLTLTGEAPGEDGKPAKYKMVSKTIDDDSFAWSMAVILPDGKLHGVMSINYKRKK